MLLGVNVSAQVIQAVGSRIGIQNAINAAPRGATIILPSGNITFDKSVVINNDVFIKGKGMSATIITSKIKGGYAFTIPRKSRKFVRISDLTVDGSNAGGGVYVVGDNFQFRIDNCTFRRCRTRAIETYGNAKGVIDHCTFTNNGITDIVVYGDNDASWNRPLTLGTDNAVYVENCKFTHSASSGAWHSIGSNHGSRYVFRYNEIHDDAKLNTAPIDAHGNFEYGRGSRSYEIYNNSVFSGHSFQGIYIRGGTGVIFNNKLTGDFTYPIVLEDYRSFNKKGSRYYCESYPCIDQIQQLYIWNNTASGKNAVPYIQNRGLTRAHIKEGRDYFLQENRNYKPFTYPHPLTKGNLQFAQNPANGLDKGTTSRTIDNDEQESQSNCGTGVALALLIPIVIQSRKLKKRLSKKVNK